MTFSHTAPAPTQALVNTKSPEARLLWSYHHETIDTPGVCTKDRKEKFKLNHAIISEKKKPYLWLFVDCPFESKDVKANRVKEL